MSTVLVVDDRPDARYSMSRPLALADFDVRETATGQDALRLARLPVDAIVLDLVLQDMDGFEVLQRLKDDPLTKNIPVILKSAVHQDDGHRGARVGSRRRRLLHGLLRSACAGRGRPPGTWRQRITCVQDLKAGPPDPRR
jgi:CheY-like chemotaxis protein